jgi:hypothetical protein
MNDVMRHVFAPLFIHPEVLDTYGLVDRVDDQEHLSGSTGRSGYARVAGEGWPAGSFTSGSNTIGHPIDG